MKAKDLMSREVASVDKDERLETVLETMRKRRVSKLVVLEKGHLAGVVTTGDIADELGAMKNRGVPTTHLHASSAMRRQVPTCAPETDAAQLVRTMLDEDVALVPVVHERDVVGVVTMSDLVRHVDGGARTLDSIMSAKLHVVEPSDRVIHARRLMIDHHVERLPVVDGSKLAGILGESDVAFGLARFKGEVKDSHQPAAIQRFLVEDIFQHQVVTAAPEMTVKDAATRMRDNDVGSLPVVRGERVVGIVTRSDLLPFARV